MDQRAIQEPDRPFPLISRLIRLELMAECFIERHWSSSESAFTAGSELKECKDISLALEEVEHKGSIAHRLAMLEKRLFKMSLELEEMSSIKLKASNIGLKSEKSEDGGRHLQSKNDPFERRYQVEMPREENQQDRGWKRNVKSSGKRRWFICT